MALTEEKAFCIVRASVTRPSSRGLGHCPFTAATGVRIPVGVPKFLKNAPAFAGAFFVFRRPVAVKISLNWFTIMPF